MVVRHNIPATYQTMEREEHAYRSVQAGFAVDLLHLRLEHRTDELCP